MKDVSELEWLYHRHFSERQFRMHSPGWQDGGWCGGIRGVCLELCSPLCWDCNNVFFSVSPLFFSLLHPHPSPLLLLLLLLLLLHLSLPVCIMWCFHCGYNSANRCWPLGNAASLRIAFSPLALSEVQHSLWNTSPLSRRVLAIPRFFFCFFFSENSAMRGRRLGTFHLFHMIRSTQGDALPLNRSISCRLSTADTE